MDSTQSQQLTQTLRKQKQKSWLAIETMSAPRSSRPAFKIFIFDFDHTLTNIHSGGYSFLDTNYILRTELHKVKALFRRLQSMNIWIYINTRGVVPLSYENDYEFGVAPYCKSRHLDKYIQKIFGAATEEDIDSRFVSSKTWARRKREIVDMIIAETGVDPHDVYFFDDDENNIRLMRPDVHSILIELRCEEKDGEEICFPTTVEKATEILDDLETRGLVARHLPERESQKYTDSQLDLWRRVMSQMGINRKDLKIPRKTSQSQSRK